jgi:hypothetical protein
MLRMRADPLTCALLALGALAIGRQAAAQDSFSFSLPKDAVKGCIALMVTGKTVVVRPRQTAAYASANELSVMQEEFRKDPRLTKAAGVLVQIPWIDDDLSSAPASVPSYARGPVPCVIATPLPSARAIPLCISIRPPRF